MTIQLQIIFYSMYGHIYKMTEAIAAGAAEIDNVDVKLYRVPELVPEPVLEKSGAKQAQQLFAHIPVINVHDITEADAYLFGTPTRFGDMCAQMRNFMDQLNDLREMKTFVGKVGSIYTRPNDAQSCQQISLSNFHRTLLQLGMAIIDLPHCEKSFQGNSDLGVSTATTSTMPANNFPSASELSVARSHGRHVAMIARNLKHGRSYYF